jgi:hypothetical protein
VGTLLGDLTARECANYLQSCGYFQSA